MNPKHEVPVRILKHQSGAFKIIFEGKPATITLVWGRGLGKSFFIRLIVWLLVAKYFGKKRKTLDGEITGIRIYMLMPTLKQFKQVHGALIEQELTGKWAFLGGKLNKTDWSITFPDGSFFIPVPAQLATSERGRGFRGDVTIFDEGDDIDPSIRASITKPWFSEPWSLALELIAGTPKRGRHGMLFEGWRDGQSKEPECETCYSFLTKSSECPEIFSPRLLEEARRSYPAAVFDREFNVNFDSAEGLVYSGFDENFHVREPTESTRFTKYILGIDHGWSDPGVFLVCGIVGHGEDSVAWILDEIYRTEFPNHEWDAIASTKFHGWRAWADPSRPDRINDLRRAGLSIMAADNAIDAGVGRIAELLHIRETEEGHKWARLYVHPRCTNVIREFKSYKRKPDPLYVGKFLDEIIDRDNHAMDSLRYLILGEFGRGLARKHTTTDS